jgi:hypothetical protein
MMRVSYRMIATPSGRLRKGEKRTKSMTNKNIVYESRRDWTLLLFHAGWRVTYSEIYYQYSRKWPILSQLMGYYWRKKDFQGFWGAILQKDTSLSNYYQDWNK